MPSTPPGRSKSARARPARNTGLGSRTREVTVAELGAQGDGIATCDIGRLYIPCAAPGDRLEVNVTGPRGGGHAARIVSILDSAPCRQTPACRHFGACGGCALQHIEDNTVATIKQRLLLQALERKGLANAPVGLPISVGAGTRRRIRITCRRGRTTTLGFNRRASREVLDILECLVVRPAIIELFAPLRALCAEMDALETAADIQITATETGLDLLFIPARRAEPDLAAREAAAAFADRHDLCRIAWQYGRNWEPIAERRAAIVSFAGVTVAIPPNAFLQPSKEGEDAIVGLVADALRSAKPVHIADLYAGCGTLTLPAANIAPVFAVDGDLGMTAALSKATKGRNITVQTRDLQRDPMAAAELSRFDAVIFDPPRAGARPLAEALAASDTPQVIAVSCNPASLARDLRILVDGGYQIEAVTPIDQFKWSAHVEAVATLRR